jgi:hypothetical protein
MAVKMELPASRHCEHGEESRAARRYSWVGDGARSSIATSARAGACRLVRLRRSSAGGRHRRQQVAGSERKAVRDDGQQQVGEAAEGGWTKEQVGSGRRRGSGGLMNVLLLSWGSACSVLVIRAVADGQWGIPGDLPGRNAPATRDAERGGCEEADGSEPTTRPPGYQATRLPHGRPSPPPARCVPHGRLSQYFSHSCLQPPPCSGSLVPPLSSQRSHAQPPPIMQTQALHVLNRCFDSLLAV